MARKATCLRTPYSAYNHREVPEEDTELTHVGPGTPCGEYFRRFWQPIGFSDELKDLPRRIRFLVRIWCCSGTVPPGWGCWNFTALTVARRLSSVS